MTFAKKLWALAFAGAVFPASAFVLLGHDSTFVPGDVQAGDFVYKWGDVFSLGSTGGTVTYSFLGESVRCDRTAAETGGILPRSCATSNPVVAFGAGYEALFATAFANWSNVADIDFLPVADLGVESGRDLAGQAGMIRIGAARFTSNNVYAFSMIGPIGHTNGLGADIFFNSQLFHTWPLDALLDVAMHEIGHSIGLGHSFNSDSVMRAFSQTLYSDLAADDVAGVQTIYGLRHAVPEPAGWVLAMTGLAAIAGRRRTLMYRRKPNIPPA